MLLIVPRGAHGLELLDGVVQTLNPGKTFGFGFGHAPIEIGVVAACLSGGLESVEEEVCFREEKRPEELMPGR